MAEFSWITDEFIVKTIRSIENNHDQSIDVKVNKFNVTPAVGKGENFASHLIRVTFYYAIGGSDKIKNDSIVIKLDLQNETISEELNDFDLFTKEIVLYRDIMPEMEKYLKLVKLDVGISPRCYSTCLTPKYIVLDDLKKSNYKNFTRQLGLDFKHSTVVIKKLAYFHATSAVIGVTNPTAYKYHKAKTIDPQRTYFIPLFSNLIKECSDACLNWPGLEMYHNKLGELSKVAVYKCGALFDRDNSNKFNVLNHGDPWINNIMFKYDDAGTPTDALMVDFALTYFGPPGIDLCYILFTSTANDVKESEWDRLIRIYHNELKATLYALKYPKRIPTLTEIHLDFLENGIYGVIFTFIAMGLRFLDDIENADIQNLFAETDVAKDWRKSLYANDGIRMRMEYLLEYFDRKGLLDGDF